MKIGKYLMSLFLAAAIAITPAFAADEWKDPKEIPHGTPDGAYISEEVDTATNNDPTMSTYNYIYIPPDPATGDVPNMSDLGMKAEFLMIAAFATGCMYLAVSKYAYAQPKQKIPKG